MSISLRAGLFQYLRQRASPQPAQASRAPGEASTPLAKAEEQNIQPDEVNQQSEKNQVLHHEHSGCRRDFVCPDEIRDELSDRGIILEDTKDGAGRESSLATT